MVAQKCPWWYHLNLAFGMQAARGDSLCKKAEVLKGTLILEEEKRKSFIARRREYIFILALVICGVLFAKFVIRDFRGPLLGDGDINIWGHQGSYFSRHINFFPLPHLDLENDDLLYPYGIDGTFQGWGLEREAFWTILQQLAGQGPWLQIYYLLSILITAIGGYLVLSHEHGRLASATVAFLITFCNYYSIASYPYHMIIAEVHWTLLNLLVDYVLLRRFLHSQPWSARLVVLKLALLSLNFGMGVGYVFGIVPTAFLITVAMIASVSLFRKWRGVHSSVPRDSFSGSWSEHSIQCMLLAGIAFIAGFFYWPLAAQIFIHVSCFDFSGLPVGSWPVSPLRLFLPIFPNCNPFTHFAAFNDHPDLQFAGSPGLFFVIIGATGVVIGGKRVLAVLPALLLALLFLFYIPPNHILLGHLPWLGFMRVGGRQTIIYPLVLCLCALQIPARFFRSAVGRLWVCATGLCFLIECATAYVLLITHPAPTIPLTKDLSQFMKIVHESPGDAVLDWPFCVLGAGADQQGFYADRLSGTAALQQLHGKKVVGLYLPRLHPFQVAPLWRAGWPRMFFPNAPNIYLASGQRRDFLPHEWLFIEKFFTYGNFCGIILYSDLLPQNTVQGFESRFGVPTAETQFGKAGRMLFIPKPAHLRPFVAPQLARELRLGGGLLNLPARISMEDPASDIYLPSDTPVTCWQEAAPGGRWSIGHRAVLEFYSPQRAPSQVRFVAIPFQRQRIVVTLDGNVLASFQAEPGGFREYVVPISKPNPQGDYRLVFELPDAHSPLSANIGNPDPRTLGIMVRYFDVLPGSPSASTP
jgi:hypothetical protein